MLRPHRLSPDPCVAVEVLTGPTTRTSPDAHDDSALCTSHSPGDAPRRRHPSPVVTRRARVARGTVRRASESSPAASCRVTGRAPKGARDPRADRLPAWPGA
jgi:hypothetical protein